MPPLENWHLNDSIVSLLLEHLSLGIMKYKLFTVRQVSQVVSQRGASGIVLNCIRNPLRPRRARNRSIPIEESNRSIRQSNDVVTCPGDRGEGDGSVNTRAPKARHQLWTGLRRMRFHGIGPKVEQKWTWKSW